MNTWDTANGKLTKEFVFKNFVEAVDFVNEIAVVAEKHNHHPDILIHSYKKVRIELYTHSENKITERDHMLAAEIDKLA